MQASCAKLRVNQLMITRPGLTLSLGVLLLAGSSCLLGVERADVQANAAAAPDQSLQTDKEGLAAAHAHFLAARMLESEGKMREALGHYLAFLRHHTGEPEMVAHIAELAMDYQGWDAAVKLLEESIKAHPDRPETYASFVQFALTHADEQNGLMIRALAVSDEAVKRFPTDAESYAGAVRLRLAESLRTRREAGIEGEMHREAAVKILDTATKQNVPDTAYWLGLGRIALDVWPLADGEHRAAHLAKVNPFFEKALQQAQAAQDEEAELNVADFYLFSNQIDKSASICETVVARTGSLDSRKRLMRLYDALERPDDSFQALEDLVKAYPLDVEHRRLLASHYERRMMNALRAMKPEEGAAEGLKAVEHLEAALQAGGGEVHNYREICHLLRFCNQPEKFDRFTQRAQQLYPGDPAIGAQRGTALLDLKKYAEAAKVYEDCARLAETRSPDLLDEQFYYQWGIALERSGQFDAAAQQLEKSIKLTPPESKKQAAGVMNYLGYMWLEQNRNLDTAETLLRKADELKPDNMAITDSLGWLFYKQGKYAEALTTLLKSERLMHEEPEYKPNPGDAEVYDHIAQTYDKLGQRDKAVEYWKKTLDVQPEVESIRERAERELGIARPKPPVPAPAEENEKKKAPAAESKRA
jgi:tetratricopeptide (TPR) repeat protein